MKRANGNIITETEDEETARNMTNSCDKNLFSGSNCRRTKTPATTAIILKYVPLPASMDRTDVKEEDLASPN